MKKMSEDYADDGKFSVLRSRFNNFTEENTSVYRRFQMSRQRYHYRLLLFQLTPFSNLNQILSKKMAEIPGKKLKEVHTLTNENQLDTDTASKLYNYDCPDCYFCLRALTFVPIVYLAIDHFLDCKEHMVVDWVRQMFLMEREAFNAFLGADFNHVYMLPKLAELTFHEFDSQSLYHCSLRMPGDRLANIGNAHFLARQKEAAGDIFDEEESGTELDEEELFAEERVTPEREWKGKIFGRRTLAAGCDNAEETESGNTIASMDTV